MREAIKLTLQEKITEDLRNSMKGEKSEYFSLKVILGGNSKTPKKVLIDSQVIKILRRLEKLEFEFLTRAGKVGSDYLEILQRYLPKPVAEEEVEKWIRENIDFSKYKSKLKAIGPILKHFGGLTDGNTVKAILEKI